MVAEHLSLAPTPPRVLVVDDDSMLRNLLSEVLTNEGYVVATAANASTKAPIAAASTTRGPRSSGLWNSALRPITEA